MQRAPIFRLSENRWGLFGRIVGRDKEIRANNAMDSFFNTHKPRETKNYITVVLNNDLSRTAISLTLRGQKDIDKLRSIAQERSPRSELTARIQKSTKASTAEDLDSNVYRQRFSSPSCSLFNSLCYRE
ncbi:hypothetical protein ElyMa_001484400 [Elysia marginata]|uniref:Uncharacterized protein n=1 Tax=Elysia marginata TaxID=1093978 RepID=A0AAV4J4W9_9GAST|nr:hypothetical protein ElyMa_001484400 [Elysia marginata]